MAKLNISEARNTHQASEHRRTGFQSAVAMAVRCLTSKYFEVPDGRGFQYNVMRKLDENRGPGRAPQQQRAMIASALEERLRSWDGSKPPVDRYEFRMHQRPGQILRAATILGISADVLAYQIRGCKRDPLSPEVVAYVIWAILAYGYCLVDHCGVDALRGEYPWIPEFED